MVVVLDPAHGGTDAGARGASGILEKDVVLQLAQAVRAELVRAGFRVVLTRQGDDNPSFDDRAALANAYRHAVFLTLHAASTGPTGAVRAYYHNPARPAPRDATAGGSQPAGKNASLQRPKDELTPPQPKLTGLVPWEEAQAEFTATSRQLAALLQTQLRQRFPLSPEQPSAGALRPLRSVAAPAVAVELSSVSVRERKVLDELGPGIAQAVAQALAALRPAAGGAN